ncbi:MAG: leucine--tRNA ligase [Flavobacteriales bacterium AspAUS03]
MEYDFKDIERYWQKYWKTHQTFQVNNTTEKPKYYVLDMFPYPSGSGLHVGHPIGYIASDIYARYKRAEGYHVLHPIGFDSFGLPAEQYAIQTGQHPAKTIEINIQRYKEQLIKLGFSFDWSREVRTSDPSYYRWTQWIFIQLFNSWYDQEAERARPIERLIETFEKNGNQTIKSAGTPTNPFTAEEWKNSTAVEKEVILQNHRLAFRSEATVNWCPILGTVLANDEVKYGKSERGGYPVYQKKMMQWSMRIIAYAERLLKGLDEINWPEVLKESQSHWIGKSFGARIRFETTQGNNIEVFTTRPDTIFGTTFIVLAPEHPLVNQITTVEYRLAVEAYIEETKKRNERERLSDSKNVSGQFTGAYALHPFTGKKISLYLSDYVLASYGTGAIMAVPAHDSRDHRFAKRFGLKILEVISGGFDVQTEAHETKEGYCIYSDFLDGLEVKVAIRKAIEKIEEQGIGQGMINYHLRNAVFSRQRYWGEPIPIYYKKGIAVPLPEQKLPLLLPEVEKYLPTEEGEPPLRRAKAWAWDEKQQKVVNNELIDEIRVFPLETNTMPGWAGSSWYFLRYMNPDNEERFLSQQAENYWQNVDLYIGGAEHATGHLLYARFWHKFLKDRAWVSTEEPFKKLINQGMILCNSAFVARVNSTKKFLSAGLIKNQDVQELHIDIHLLKNRDELDVEKFKKWRPEFTDAELILEGGKFFCRREVEKMSKSKYNVINPDEICKKYGADTLRMYEMFLGPLDQAKLWNTQGITGVHHFLRKFWHLFHSTGKFHTDQEPPTAEEFKVLHQTIKKVREDIESFSFNTSVSAFMIAVNTLTALKCCKHIILEPLVILIAPFAPHIAEVLWQRLGHKDSVGLARMPNHDPQYLIEKIIEYPVMFNGKLRFKVHFQEDIPTAEIEQQILKHPKTQDYLNGKALKKIIIIPKKLINIVL